MYAIRSYYETEPLQFIISSYQDHEGYDKKAYPLGLFTKDYYKSEANFAQTLLDKLSEVDQNTLGETDKISAKLLAFELQDKIDYYKFEQYLNPILSDEGFHSVITSYSIHYTKLYDHSYDMVIKSMPKKLRDSLD